MGYSSNWKQHTLLHTNETKQIHQLQKRWLNSTRTTEHLLNSIYTDFELQTVHVVYEVNRETICTMPHSSQIATEIKWRTGGAMQFQTAPQSSRTIGHYFEDINKIKTHSYLKKRLGIQDLSQSKMCKRIQHQCLFEVGENKAQLDNFYISFNDTFIFHFKIFINVLLIKLNYTVKILYTFHNYLMFIL